MQSIKISCTVKTLEDFHIGTGTGNIGLYDDGQYKDNNGLPTINASTMKGLLRDSCAVLDRAKLSLGLPVNLELFAKLFQNFDNLSSLDIDIKPITQTDALKDNTLIHYFTAVDHAKRKAKETSLRSMEFGAKGLEFELQLCYLNRDGDSEQLCQYLVEGLKNIKSIGGHRRRGFGAIAILCATPLIEDISAIEHQKKSGKRLEIIFELAEDTIISSKAQSGNLLSTNDYIPGTTILGMFRSLLLGQGLQSSCLDDERVSTSFFYPMPMDHNCNSDIEICPAFISFRKKKAYPTASSFEADSKLSSIPSWALNLANGNKLSDILSQNTLIKEDEHSDQGKGVYDGYLFRRKTDVLWEDAEYYKTPKLYHQRNSINPEKQSTATSGIFIEEKLKRGTCFLGSLSFATEEDCASFTQEFSSWLEGNRKLPLHIGRGGKAMYVKEFQHVPASDSKAIILSKDNSFTLSLLSDAILYDEKLQPCATISTGVLAAVLGEAFTAENFELLTYVSRSGVISSYSGTSGLRRFRDLAIRKGSCYSFKYLGTDTAVLQKRLGELVLIGIGFRKHEGFGSIAINHPLHIIKPSVTNTSPQPEISHAKTPVNEKNRLTQKAAMYNNAEYIAGELKGVIEGKLWGSMAADTLVQIESGVSLTQVKERFKPKMDKDTSGAWGEKDSRYKIAKVIIDHIDKLTPTETMATALKLLLEGKGEK